MKTSPRTSSNSIISLFSVLKDSGIEGMVLKLRVISSPVNPSPLVDPCESIPFLYTNSTPSPSSLGSATISID